MPHRADGGITSKCPCPPTHPPHTLGSQHDAGAGVTLPSLPAHPATPQELASRLSRYYREAEAGLAVPAEGPFAVSFEDALPLEDFFEVGVG